MSTRNLAAYRCLIINRVDRTFMYSRVPRLCNCRTKFDLWHINSVLSVTLFFISSLALLEQIAIYNYHR